MAIYDIDGAILSNPYFLNGEKASTLFDIDGNAIFSGVQPYFINELNATIESVRNAQTEPCLTFAVVTDIHYNSVDKIVFPHTLQNIKAFSEQVHLDGILCLGDMTDGDKTKAVTTGLLEEIMPTMRGLGLPVYFCAGNHDCNAYGAKANVYTTFEMYENYYRYGSQDVCFDADSYFVNYYKDFDDKRIRMISLDSAKSDDGSAYHYYYPMNTVDWFVNTVMATLPTGYSVLLVSHVSPIANHNWKDTCPTNNADVESTLRDFVNNGGKVVCVYGHSHADFNFTSPWLDIAVCCNRFNNYADKVIGEGDESWFLPIGAKLWHKEMNTYKEDCWDVAIIKPQSKTINMIRFGAGEDRAFTY